MNYLRDELEDKEKQLFLVVTPEVEQKQKWLKDIESYNNVTGTVDNLVNNDQYLENIK